MKKGVIKMKKRLPYIIAALILLAVEIFIGVYVKDDIIRPYGGDILVTALLCAIVRSVWTKPFKGMWLWVFAFSIFVEITQYFHLADLLGIHNKIVRIIMGGSFSFMDIICYFVGCLAFHLIERAIKNRKAFS